MTMEAARAQERALGLLRRKRKKRRKRRLPRTSSARALRTWKPGQNQKRRLRLWHTVLVATFDSGYMFMRQFSRLLVLACVFYVLADSDPEVNFPLCEITSGIVSVFCGYCLGRASFLFVPLASGSLFTTASPEEYRKIGSCRRGLLVLALFAHGNLAIILCAPWCLTRTRAVPGLPEEYRKIAGVWEMASVDTRSCVSLLRRRIFTFFFVKADLGFPRSGTLGSQRMTASVSVLW